MLKFILLTLLISAALAKDNPKYDRLFNKATPKLKLKST